MSSVRSAFELTGRTYIVTGGAQGIGFTIARDETDLSKIMRVADRALYIAKHGGRNQVARVDAPSLAAA